MLLLILRDKEVHMPKKGRRTGYTINCENCGKEIYQTKTQYNRAKHHFCGNKCQKEFQHKQLYENRKCQVCNSLFEASKKSKQIFCSTKCQNVWQKTNTGEDNVRFKGSVCNCDWCNKKIVIGKSNMERFSHHFCSNECRQGWYSNVYSQADEWKEESRIRATKILEKRKIDTNTKPQIIINNLLDTLHIKYTNEKNVKYYSLDNYLDDNNLAIEVMGDFWHTNPLIYTEFPTRKIQTKRIPKDKAKHTYVKKYCGYEILYLWESDIYKNLDMCKKLIQKYINENGLLENYHSFNYHLKENDLVLNSKIIYPYFEKEIVT